MMLTALHNLLVLAMVFVCVASISVLVEENKNSVLPRTVHAVCCGLHSRIRADHRPPKPGAYISF